MCESLLGQAHSVIFTTQSPPQSAPSVSKLKAPLSLTGQGSLFVPKVSQSHEITAKNAIRRHKLPNLPFARKISPHFVISPEIVLDNGERVWYHTFVR